MADISKFKTPDGTTYSLKDETARNSKTNTSVLPNDGGEIKTKFRMSQKGYTNGAIWYYPLCKLPKDNAENYASAILSGRVGGWISNNMSSITSLIWNRGSSDIALLDIAGSANAMSSIWSLCDIVVYTNSDTTDTVYLKCNNYFTFDVDIELFQSGCEILYNGSYATTTPSGTLAASASTSTKRAELINGKLYIAGSELAFKSAIPTKTSQLTNDSGFKTTDSNTTYSLSKSGSTITLTGSDGSTTSVTDSNTTYSTATQSANGLMSADDKAKLDGLSDGVFDNDVTFNGSKVNHVISPSDSFTQDNIYKRSDSGNPVVSAEYYRSKADNSENAKYSRIFMPGSTSAYTDLRVTANTSGADWNFIGTGLETRLKVNNNLVYHAGYKPYAMGTVSLAANATKCTVSFGFTPSHVIWWTTSYIAYSATAFDSTSFTVSSSSSAARSVSYIAFR